MANSANLTYYQRHKEKLLIKAREYYKNNGDKIKEKRDNLPEEKKNKIKEYQRQWRNNKSEDAIIKGREYAKIGIAIYLTKKKIKGVNILKEGIRC